MTFMVGLVIMDIEKVRFVFYETFLNLLRRIINVQSIFPGPYSLVECGTVNYVFDSVPLVDALNNGFGLLLPQNRKNRRNSLLCRLGENRGVRVPFCKAVHLCRNTV